MFGHEIEIDEDVVPNENWDELEKNFFNAIRKALKDIKDGKRDVDRGSDQKAGRSTKKSRREKRRENPRKSPKEGGEVQKS